jgi:hypothetical protein
MFSTVTLSCGEGRGEVDIQLFSCGNYIKFAAQL